MARQLSRRRAQYKAITGADGSPSSNRNLPSPCCRFYNRQFHDAE